MARRLKIIRIPTTPASAYDRQRPASDLLRAQVRHARDELRRWVEAHGEIDPERFLTEQEGAAYVERVTRLLHPEGAHPTAATLPDGRAPKSGVWLGPKRRTRKAPRRKPARPRARRKTGRGNR
jgi:hypothetical protein